MTRFIGQDGFYPKWAQSSGRWVHQKVPIQTGNMPLIFPPEARQFLVWVPPKTGFLGIRKISIQTEITNSIRELNLIPFVCTQCGWKGFGTQLGYAGERSYYSLSCPECLKFEGIEPDLSGLNSDLIVERWVKLGKPPLENPGAAPNIVSAKSITDLQGWIESFNPMLNEIAYVGQQLWPNFASFIGDAKKLE